MRKQAAHLSYFADANKLLVPFWIFSKRGFLLMKYLLTLSLKA
ncbi:hypothetical protein HMPREF0971_00037 [Segatella oris F0302]|uniref:Uncharacterized protein n=1 Tax=Segatella oris F0302 TaxID=649760 RepID=D1QM55_9BACT|nr:hypothetical protein HMPREF0971_00037 [Segatella oris F0302]